MNKLKLLTVHLQPTLLRTADGLIVQNDDLPGFYQAIQKSEGFTPQPGEVIYTQEEMDLIDQLRKLRGGEYNQYLEGYQQ